MSNIINFIYKHVYTIGNEMKITKKKKAMAEFTSKPLKKI